MNWIEKLNGNNFLTWKRRILYVLFQDHLDYVLDEVVAKPPKDAEGDIMVSAYEKYVWDDKKTRSIMLTFMETNVELLFEDYP